MTRQHKSHLLADLLESGDCPPEVIRSAAAQDEDGDEIKELQDRLQDALECIRKLSAERVNVRAAVRRLHSAKGRQQKQQALYDLFDLVGL